MITDKLPLNLYGKRRLKKRTKEFAHKCVKLAVSLPKN